MKVLNTIPNLSENTAVAMGLFDGVHIGHKSVIETAVKSGYLPIVFTFSVKTQFPVKKNGMLLLNTKNVKYDLLEKLGVQLVVEPPFGDIKEISAKDFVCEYILKKLHAKMVVCGENFHFGKDALGGQELLKKLASKLGIKVNVVSSAIYDGEVVSSSRVRKAIAVANLQTVREMLGYDYFWDYEVVSGDKNGRKIGYPTINQHFPVGYIVPKRGVYASKVNVGGNIYLGVTNIGVRPTLNKLENPIAETYIINYSSKPLYNENIRVSINKYLREEKKFGSIDELKREISKNVLEASNQSV
ncbi:MAG: riboflavin biosynthesis protein RibF [Oscillospiraceae bacterium]|nr:riboflavin biosynthesis protein RibF [Oscillospiraceae bacterium]